MLDGILLLNDVHTDGQIAVPMWAIDGFFTTESCGVECTKVHTRSGGCFYAKQSIGDIVVAMSAYRDRTVQRSYSIDAFNRWLSPKDTALTKEPNPNTDEDRERNECGENQEQVDGEST